VGGRPLNEKLAPMAQTVAAILVVLLATGCQSLSDASEQRHLDRMRAKSLADIDKQKCARDGGTIRGVGMFGLFTCVIPYADAGKACSDTSECRGTCVAPEGAKPGSKVVGKCQSDSAGVFGCSSAVKDGIVLPGLCND
jgi:hypothetical protein